MKKLIFLLFTSASMICLAQQKQHKLKNTSKVKVTPPPLVFKAKNLLLKDTSEVRFAAPVIVKDKPHTKNKQTNQVKFKPPVIVNDSTR